MRVQARRTAVIGRRLAMTSLLLALTGCGADNGSETTDDCASDAACGGLLAESRPADPATPGPPLETKQAPENQPTGPVTTTFERADAPDGQTTVPLPTIYLGQAESDSSSDRLALRIEYPDLCQTLVGVHVVETPDMVTVTGVATSRQVGACPLRLLIATGTVRLDEPLGDRTVKAGP